eukprot:143208-Rhodomonas_salina.3
MLPWYHLQPSAPPPACLLMRRISNASTGQRIAKRSMRHVESWSEEAMPEPKFAYRISYVSTGHGAK